MKRSILIVMLSIILSSFLYSCTSSSVKSRLLIYEKEFNINLPKEYEILFNKSTSSMDSHATYTVLKVTDQEYTLAYEDQLTSDYAYYEDFNLFKKIEQAKMYFQHLIKDKDEQYFIESLSSYDWYGYEYKSITGRYDVVRYIDLYVIHDINSNFLYIFYDKHQYPYNDQSKLN